MTELCDILIVVRQCNNALNLNKRKFKEIIKTPLTNRTSKFMQDCLPTRLRKHRFTNLREQNTLTTA